MLLYKWRTDINGSVHYLGFSLIKNVHAPMPPNRGSTVPYLPKIYGKPCTWWKELNLELTFETQSTLQFY